MTARHEAQALVELGRPVIERAWSYQSTWAALTVGKVPANLRREVLDSRHDIDRTESMDRVDAWDGSPAPLVIVGDVGQGKSFAAAMWLKRRAQNGKSIAWISGMELGRLPFDRDRKREQDRDVVTLRDEERRAAKSCATVIDDLGAGSLNQTVLGRVKALILEREGAGLPTLVLINRSEQLESWISNLIDARVGDRMRGAGSSLVKLKPTPSLRDRRKIDDTVDPNTGRGKAWKSSAALLQTIGVLDDYDGEQWRPGASRTVVRPVFGHAIETAHCRRSDWPRIFDKLCEALRLDPEAVRRRADQIEAEERHGREEIDRLEFELPEAGTNVIGLGGFVDRLTSDVEAERSARIGSAVRAGDFFEPTKRPPNEGPEPSFAPGEKARLAAMGYRVVYSDLRDEHELRHRLTPANGEPKPDKKGQLLGLYATEGRAWAAARELQKSDHDMMIAQ